MCEREKREREREYAERERDERDERERESRERRERRERREMAERERRESGERETEIFFLLTNAMAKFDILFNSGHLYSLIPNNISGHSHATAPFIDNQFGLAHVYVQIEQASAE